MDEEDPRTTRTSYGARCSSSFQTTKAPRRPNCHIYRVLHGLFSVDLYFVVKLQLVFNSCNFYVYLNAIGTPADNFLRVTNCFLLLQVNGIVINLPYTSVSSIVTKVLSFGVHNNETDIEKTECGVSVYVHPYPSHVLSVWVFIGYTLKDNLL